MGSCNIFGFYCDCRRSNIQWADSNVSRKLDLGLNPKNIDYGCSYAKYDWF